MRSIPLFACIIIFLGVLMSGCSTTGGGGASGEDYRGNIRQLAAGGDLPVVIVYPQGFVLENRARRTGEFFDGVVSDQSAMKMAIEDATKEIFDNVSTSSSSSAKLVIEVRGVSVATRRSGEYFSHMEVKLKSPNGNVFTTQMHEDDLEFGEPMNRDAIYATNKSAYINALTKAFADIRPMVADIRQSSSQQIASSGSGGSMGGGMSGSGQGAKEGTAFFINKQGNLITHAGFAEQCNNMQMWFEGRQYPLNVVMSDPAMEVAVLSSSVVPRITAVFKNDGDAVNGESTLAVGYNNDGTSMSRSPTILQGSVESAQGVNGDMNYLQLSLPSKMGNEGAPVVSSSGHTVGMLVGQGTAVRGDSIKQYLSRSGVNYRFHSGAGRRFDTNRLANHARSYTVKVFCR